MSVNSTDITRIGIAGFMGAGKTTCARFLSSTHQLSSRDIPIIDADKEAKRFMQSTSSIKENLIGAFGPTVVKQGFISFPILGAIVFNSLKNLQTLNTIVHPSLVKKLKELVFSQPTPCVILDAALIPLWKIEEWFDLLIWVHASFKKRYERLRGKSALFHADLMRRIDLQQAIIDEPKGPPWKIISNEGTPDDLKLQIASFYS